MIDVIAYTQKTLDDALLEIPLRSYWLRRLEIDEDDNPDEYIVYDVNEHEPGDGADGEGLFYTSYISVRYFCREGWLSDTERYADIKDRLSVIRFALLDAGFDVSSGWSNVGDVNGDSYQAFVLSAEYAEVDRGGEPG